MNHQNNAHVTSFRAKRYWKKNLCWLGVILLVWFTVSFGCGILFRDWLDIHFPKVGNAPFGFWMAQQGSIISFVAILIAYTFLMNRLDSEYHVNKGEEK
ncbi:MAG: DUF4212 domain-containing protein [Akkermansiaceae bacterium]